MKGRQQIESSARPDWNVKARDKLGSKEHDELGMSSLRTCQQSNNTKSQQRQ